MKFLITGFPGTGKTTTAHALKARGRSAYDPQQMQGYMRIESREGGHVIHAPKPVPKSWYDSVGAYRWDHSKISTLLESQDDVYICSLAENQSKYYDAFDMIFVLHLPDKVLIQRLKGRDLNALGHNKDEQADILLHRGAFEQQLVEHGAHLISTLPPPGEVVDAILAAINS